MTVAIRSFNMEMSEAQRVTDVYSALAAKTASTTEELAIAMSKTASGAANVGSSFEATSAMLSTMISVTRESAQNLGSALKSIVSRYGEMTKNPLSLMDEDGNIASLNKVDTALQSIGISIHDANGEFRDFDDVILELAQSWNTVDKNTQRWIATTLAGNRQQSRFLALVSNGEYYARALKIAESAQDSATLQTLKTLDSLESKIQQVKVSLEQFYSSMGIEKVIKGVLTTVNTVIKNINKMAKPQALVTLFNLFNGLKNIVLGLFSTITGEINKVIEQLDRIKAEALSTLELKVNADSANKTVDELGDHLTEVVEKPRIINIGTSVSEQPIGTSKIYTQEEIKSALSQISTIPKGEKFSLEGLARMYGLQGDTLKANSPGEKIQAIIPPETIKQLANEKGSKKQLTIDEVAQLIYEKQPKSSRKEEEGTRVKAPSWLEKNPDKAAQVGMIVSTLGATITALGLTMKDTSQSAVEASKMVSGFGNTVTGLGSAFATAARYGFSPTGIVLGLVSALPSIITGITQFFDGIQKTAAEQTQMLQEEFQTASDSSLVAKGKASELKSSIDQLVMLRDAQYDSADASKEYLDYMNQMADTYPTLVAQYDSAGNAILSVEAAEQLLIETRRAAAAEATNAAKKELELREQQKKNYEQAADTLGSILEGGSKSYDLSRLEAAAQSLGYGEDLVAIIVDTFGEWSGSAEDLASNLAMTIRKAIGTTEFDATAQARNVMKIMESDQGTIKGRGYTDDEITGMAKQLSILIDEYSIAAEDLGLEKGDIETQLRNAKDLPTLIESIYKRVETKLGYLDNQLTSVEDSLAKAKVSTYIIDSYTENDLIQENIDGIQQLAAAYFKQAFGEAKVQNPNVSYDDWLNENFNDIVKEFDSSVIKRLEDNADAMKAVMEGWDRLSNFKGAEEVGQYFSKYIGDDAAESIVAQYVKIRENVEDNIQKATEASTGLTPSNQALINSFFDDNDNIELISAYSSSILEVIKTVNAYASRGLNSQAQAYQNAALSVFKEIANISDSETQEVLYASIKDIDFTSTESLRDTITAVTDYAEANNKVEELQGLLDALNAAVVLIPSNIFTLADTLTSTISSEAKDFQKVLDSAAKGMSFEDAIESVQKLSLTEAGADKTFNELVEYNAELDKWVYTQDGFEAVLEQNRKKVQEAREDFEQKRNQLDLTLSGISNAFSFFGEDIVQGLSEDTLSQQVEKFRNWGIDPTQAEQILKAYLSSDKESFGEFWTEYLNNVKLAEDGANEQLIAWEKNQVLTFLDAIDFSKLSLGDQYSKGELTAILEKYFENTKVDVEQVVEDLIKGIIPSELVDVLDFSTKQKITTARASAYGTAISELLDGPGTQISETTQMVLAQEKKAKTLLDTSQTKLVKNSQDLVTAAIDLYRTLEEEGKSSVEELNNYAAEIINRDQALSLKGRRFETSQLISSRSFSIDELKEYATSTDKLLTDFFDFKTRKIADEYADYLYYDRSTGKIKVKPGVSYSDLLKKISGGITFNLDNATEEQLEAYSNFVDATIKEQTAKGSTQASQIQSIIGAKVGDLINVSYLNTELSSILGKTSEYLNDGILTIANQTLQYNVLSAIASMDAGDNSELQQAIYAARDALVTMMQNWANLIKKGFEGTLGAADVATLQSQFGLSEIDFTETAQGLKLSEQAAISVYTQLKQIDSIQAELAFKELSDGLKSASKNYDDISSILARIAELREKIANVDKGVSNERLNQYKQELSVAEEILKIRSSTDPDSFKFMDNKLPTSMQGPQNYWDAVGKAYTSMNEASKEGYMDIEDYYNIINEMTNMVIASNGKIEVMGMNSSNVMTKSADLLNQGLEALTNVDGKGLKVSLKKLGADFLTGSEGMKTDFDKGVKEMARQQIQMLDAAIGMLKAIVALEELSGNDGVFDDSDVFTDPINKKGLKEGVTEFVTTIDTAAGGIKIGSESLSQAIEGLAQNNPEKVVELLNGLLNIDFTLGDAEVLSQIMTVLASAFNKPITTKASVFELLDLLPNAEEDNEEFQAHLKKLGLTWDEYVKLRDAIINEEWDDIQTDKNLSNFVKGAIGEDMSLEQFVLHKKYNLQEIYDEDKGTSQTIWVDSAGNEHRLPQGKEDSWERLIAQWERNVQSSKLPSQINEELGQEEQVDIKLANSVKLGLTQAFEAKDFRDNLATSIFDAIIAAIAKVAGMNFGAETVGQEVSKEISNGTEVQGPQLPQPQSQGNNQFLNVTIQTTTNTDGVIAEVINNGSQLTDLTQNINIVTTHTTSGEAPADSNVTQSVNTSYNADTSSLDAAVVKIAQAATQAAENIEKVATALDKINDKSTEVSNTAKAIDKLHSKEIKATIDTQIDVKVATILTGSVPAVAKGTIISKRKNVNLTANAKGTHSAIGGNTLMGELGPELVVSNGHYYTVGNNGAEMVNLPKDAIVFNHKQTADLLRKGSISGRGEAVTSEKNAISFAKGTGPAMASAKDALAQLEAIRAMWQAMLDASAKDLGSMAGKGGKSGGSGKGGKGGGKGSEDNAYLGDLERWYNLLRQIENLEEKISLEEAKRKNYVNGIREEGYEYSKSLKTELDYLREQQKAQKELNALRRDWYDIRRKELADSDYSKIFTFNEEGLMQYTDGKNRGLDILATLNETDIYGKPTMTSKQQVDYLKSLGFDIESMRYGDDGKQVKASDYAGIIKNFWSNIDSFMDELDGLWDDVADGLKEVEENQAKQNELLEDVRSNRLDVEDKLLNAIIDLKQATIDALQDQLDATQEAGDKYLDGLKDALAKEREMYSQQQTDSETASLQARLAILQRTGGSASEIKSLQDQLSSRYQDSYFQAQEDAIDETEQALNNQIEKLQEQIDIQTEILDYQKEHGLLWAEVYDMLDNWDVDSIASFITTNTKEYWDDSPVAAEKTLEEVLQKAQRAVSAEEVQLLKDIKDELAVRATDSTTGPSSGYYTRDGKYYHDSEEISKEDYEKAMKQSESDRKWYSQYLDKLESQTKVAELQDAAMTAENTLALAEDFLEQIQEDYGTASQEYKDLSTLISGTTSNTTAKNALKNIQAMLSGTGKYAGQEYGEKFNDALTGISSYKQVKTGLAGLSSSAYGAFTTAVEQDIGYQQALLEQESNSLVIKAPAAMYAYDEPERKNVVASYQSATASKAEKKKVPAGTTLVIDGFAGQAARDQFRATWVDAKGQSRTGYFKLGTSDAEKALLDEWKRRPAVPQYLHGGMVDFTGPAWVDGSKKKPEAFLSAEDTALLKSKLFSNSEYSLKSIVDSIKGMQTSVNAASNLGNESFVFENVTLNIGSGTIANDYDARRAGQMVIEEMTRIARKTGNLSINRR